MRPLAAGDLIARIDELLEVTYRSGDLGNVPDVLSETVYILLSLNTRETVYRRVYEELRERFPKWTDAEQAPLAELSALLQRPIHQRQQSCPATSGGGCGRRLCSDCFGLAKRFAFRAHSRMPHEPVASAREGASAISLTSVDSMPADASRMRSAFGHSKMANP
jgi:hypothetical protein